MFKGRIIKFVDAYSLYEVTGKLNISPDDVLGFLMIHKYILLIDGKYYPTILGLESGCVVNSSSEDVIGITKEGFERIKKAFTPEFTQSEIEQIDAIVSYINQEAKND